MSEARYYEDLQVGARWETAGRTITDADVNAFARISGDFNPVHVDAKYASSTPFGERIAHGALVLAIATGLRQDEGTFRGTLRAWLGMRDWRFLAPVRFGDTIHVVTEIVALRDTKDTTVGLVTQGIEVRNQHGEVVQAGEFATLIARREARL
jgi:acyl dehydratase